MLMTTVKNQTNNLDLELPSVAHRLDTDSERMRFNYDIGKLNTEFRFPSSVKKKASTAATLFNRLKINDPDILRDLGEPTRVEDSSWLRSASCKELSARQIQQHLSNEGSSHKRVNHGRSFPNKFDRNCYSSHGQAHVLERGAGNQSPPEIKFYSNSYPGMGGTSDKSKGNANTGTSAGTSPGAAIYLNEHMIENNIENYYEDKNDEDVDDGDKDGHWKVSAEDLSHDSYEILERESAFRSKSSSVNSDEMFIMENDYKSISKHILWKEESMDVEKRLGYVEPKYRDIDFNQFNEICKRGFALRNRNASQSHGNIKFSEYAVKSGDSSIWKEDRMEKKRIFHDAVGRTKSDPYMCSEHKALNKQKLFGLHQKSFDLAAPDADNLSFVLSKSSVDIPYTLRIRNEMNGTARDQDSLAGFDDSDTAEPSRCKSEGAGSVFVAESKIKSQASMYASYDSGLSLSLGNDNVDDNEINLKNVLFTKNYEQVVTTKKSTKLMLSLSEENNENVDATEQPVPVSTKQPSVRAKNVKNAKIKSVEEHDKGKQHIIKVKSVEAPKKNYSTKIRKSKSAESYIRKNSFLYADSASFRGKKEIIVIDSDEYHSFDDSRSDKRSDGSDSVIIVEYRGNKRKKLSKKTSSDSRGSQAESEASSFDAPRIKKKDLKKRNTSTYFYNKERIPTIEISEDEIYKVEYNNGNLGVCHTNEYEYSSDERQASGSDLSKTDFGNEIVTDELASPDKKISGDIIPSDAVLVVSDEMSPTSALKVDNVEQPLFSSNVACTIKVNQDFTSSIFGVKNCQILTKLGFSEGSAIVHSRPTLSPTIARRAKSLDTPIISLHRLPPVTSFSSKDDTVDNEEGVILEEKALSKKKYKNSSSEDQPLQVELQKAREPYVEKPEVKIKPNLKVLTNRLKSNSIPVPSLRKKSYDASTPDFNGRNWPETETLNKERSKSEGYEDNLLKNITLNTPDKKHSSRQERLDSFKKLKNFSIELWESDDVEQNRKKTLLNSEDDKDYDNVFVDAMENINRKKEKKDLVDINKEKPTDLLQLNDTKLPAEEVPQFSLPKPEAQISVEVTEAIPKSNYSEQQEYLPCLPNMTSVPDFLPVSEKRNFDEELSTSSSIPAEVINHVPFDNSGSSSEEEAILPPDYPEEEMPDLQPMHITLDMSIATIAVGVKPPPATLSAPFNSGFFSLSRTLSRISERSTTSEQEHTDFDDDSTKPLSRSVSIDDSILSSDQHYSISSDPPSGMNLENVFDDDDFPVDSELDQIPSSLLLGDKKWPSPSHSLSSIKTPIINSEMYSAVPDVVTLSEGSINMFQLENDDGKEEEVSVSEDRTLQEDNEYLLEHDQNEKFHRTERTQGSIGDDTSACITTSDWSSSTGTTIKNAQTRTQCVSKSEDNSLTCEYGASLSNDIISESRKSIDELDSLFCEKKYLSLDSKQTSVERKIIFLPPIFHSFDDEYDSPYTESEDSPSNSMSLFRKQLPAPPEAQPLGEKLKLQDQPPTPPIHCQNNASSCVQRLRTRVERNRAVKFLPQYTSSSMSTSLESPTNAERKLAKAIAKAKCYSYYSLARSPPSDGSSSSGDLPDTPLIPNTIPRVSKRRRNLNPSRRPQLREQCKFNCSRSSTCRQPFYHPSRRPKY